MRAAIIEAWGEPPRITEMAEPVRTRGHTLVSIDAAVVGHLDVSVSSGEFGVHPELPYIGGVEGVGTVIESDVWSPGSKVMVRGAGVGLVRGGTWCESAVIPDDALMPAPEGMDEPLAAAFFVPTTTAFVAVHDICEVTDALLVHVTGAGGAVGSLAVQMALRAGATVVAISRDPSKVDGVNIQGWSEDRLIRCTPEDDPVALAGRPADCLIETLGGPGFGQRLRNVAPGGVCALVGYAMGPRVELDVPNVILGDVSIVPVNMLRREERAREVARGLAEDLLNGALHLRVQAYPLAEITEALAQVTGARADGRVVIRPRA